MGRCVETGGEYEVIKTDTAMGGLNNNFEWMKEDYIK